MPRINIRDIDFDDEDMPRVEPIRRNTDPVTDRPVNQRRAENGINRFRKAREIKERNR